MTAPATASPARRAAAWSLIALLLCQPGTGLAQVVAAGSGPYRPTVQTAANGVPLVQITAPSAAGVSRNQYQQFDVGSPGLVLNNSQVLTQTQQAGWIAGNPNLAGGSARLILNEVTSSLPSRLAGYTEVAGVRAEVIIANPNGITCDGCGFINTSRGVLTTGTPVFGGDGSLAAFRVASGRIDVQGAGLDAANVDQFDLIARSVSVNAGLWAKRLNVVAGANQVDYASLGAQAIAGQGAAPAVAIDVALLGGMYADKIRLVGTEAGVGVAIAGTLAARMEDMDISSAGRLTFSGTAAAARHLSLSGTELALAGANLAAGGDATLTATVGGIDHQGALTSAAGRLAVSAAGALDNRDGGLLGGDVDIVAASLDNRRGSILQAGGSGSTITLAGALDNRGGWIEADITLTLAAQGIDNSDGRIANTGTGDTRLSAGTGALTNANGGGALGMGTVSAGGRLFATAGQIANTQAGTFLAAGNAEFVATAGTLDNTGGNIGTAGRLRITTAQDFAFNLGDILRGDGGIRIESGAGLRIGVGAALGTPGNLELAATGDLVNLGTLSADNLILAATNLDNQGALAAMTDLTANVSGRLTNRSGRLIYAGQDQFLYVNELINEEDATVWAGRHIAIQKNAAGDRAASVTNQIGLIEAQGDLLIRADTLTNQGSSPAVNSRGVADSVPYAITACPGPGPAPGVVNGGCIPSSHQVQIGVDGNGDPVFQTVYDTNAAGEIIYNSTWGFRAATPGEVAAYFSRNPNAPRVVGGTDLTRVPTNPSGDAHEREGGWEVSAAGTEQFLAPGTVVKTARLLAGRDFVFAGGDIANRVGQIAATRDVTLIGSSLVNQGLELQRVVTYTAAGYTLSAGRHMPWGPLYTDTITETLESVPASITAGGVLAGNLTVGLMNDASARPALNARSAGSDAAAAAALPATPIATLQQAAGIGGAPAGLAGGAQLVAGRVVTSHVTLPTSATGLFTAAPPGAGYLIEANPLFADRGSFLSSDFFLQSLGLDPAATEKRLGDGFYEQALVRDQIFALTGRRLLADASSSEAQFRALMEAGVAMATSLHLTVGIDLTPAQVAALTTDIVWLVEREVQGQKVLVPQVYLSRIHARDLAPSGALMAGADIDLVAPDLKNLGRISARDRLRLAGTDITNRGIVETTAADGLTGLLASRDLVNEGGSISGGSVFLSAGRDLLNRAERFTVTAPGLTDTELGAAGRIVARDGASLQAGRDIVFAGGQLAAGGDVSLSARRNLDLSTATKETRFAMAFAGGSGSSTRMVEGGSLIDAGGALTLSAGGDLTVTGSHARAASIDAFAGGDLVLAAAKDRETGNFSFAQGKGGSTFAFDRETVKGSSLSASGDVTLVAGAKGTGNLAIVGSTVTAGRATLAANGDILIGSAQQNRGQESHTWGPSKGLLGGGRKGDSRDTEFSSTAIGSAVAARGDLTVLGGNVVLQGSALDAGGTLTMRTTGDLVLLAGQSVKSRSIQSVLPGETLSFALEESRGLLSSLAGSTVDVAVGGNLVAQTGARDAQGHLETDRMTAQGVVRGSSRQQVSVSGSGEGTSQVLGNLSAQGIRASANDSFAAPMTVAGQEAVTTLMQSGLVSLRQDPALQILLAFPPSEPTTTRDGSGRLKLTVAGEARAQAIYNQLRLSEVFVKHPDQGTAQLAAMAIGIAIAIYLGPQMSTWVGNTFGTAAGSTFAAATATTTAGLGNVMLSGALTSMISSATSQFIVTGKIDTRVLLKAGVTSGLTAGLDQGLGLDKAAGVKDLAGTASRIASGNFGNVFAMAERELLNATISTGINGGSFGNAFTQGFVSDLAAVGANAIGTRWGGGSANANPFLQTVAHAGLGAGIASLRGQDPLAGAIGGATESIIGSFVPDSTLSSNGGKALYAAGATLAGGILANALGRDAIAGAMTAQNAAINNRLLHQDQIARIKALNPNDPEREKDQLAVLCYLQNCSIDGTRGQLGQGDETRLYRAGENLKTSDPQLFDQLASEIKSDPVLLQGNFAYGDLSYIGTRDRAADAFGSMRFKDAVPMSKAITSRGLDEAIGQSLRQDEQNVRNTVQSNPVLGPIYGTGRAVVTALPVMAETVVDAGNYLSPVVQLGNYLSGSQQTCLSDLCSSIQTQGAGQTLGNMGSAIASLPSQSYDDIANKRFVDGTEKLMNLGLIVDGGVNIVRAGTGPIRSSAAAADGTAARAGGALAEPSLVDAEISALPVREARSPAITGGTATTSDATTATGRSKASASSLATTNTSETSAPGASLPANASFAGAKTTIHDIYGPTSFVVEPMSQVPSNLTAGERLGNLGERDLAKPVLDSLSPGNRPLQNRSGNGSDSIGVPDPTTKTISVFEIKTTDSGNRQSVGDLVQRNEDWINEAASTGKINGQELSAADKQFAKDLQEKLDQGYSIKPYVLEVAVPPQGQSASPVVTVIPYPRPTPMPRPTTAPFGAPAPTPPK